MKLRLADLNPKIINMVVGGITILLLLIIVISALIPKKEVLPVVASSNPQNESAGVIITVPITVSFQTPLDDQQKANIAYRTQPDITLVLRWVDDTTLELLHREPFSMESTAYTITILYKDREIHALSFTTADKTLAQIEEEAREQAADDFLFGEAEKEFHETYPWYSSLPIETSEYVIVYNFERVAFRIRLTLPQGALGSEVGAAKSRALEDLRDIGVDLNRYAYYFLED